MITMNVFIMPWRFQGRNIQEVRHDYEKVIWCDDMMGATLATGDVAGSCRHLVCHVVVLVDVPRAKGAQTSNGHNF